MGSSTPAFHVFDHAEHLPAHCRPVDSFLLDFSATFHTCVPTYLAFVSTLLGTLSIVSWLFAQLPQIYKNYRIQSTAGLSIFFLVEWCLGDTTNLIGALLTGQATWQVIVAAYYTFVDCVLVVQYIWYERLGHGRKARRRLVTRTVNASPGAGPSESDPLLANGNTGPANAAVNGSAARSKDVPAQTRSQQFSSFHFPAIGGSPREKSSDERTGERPMVRTVKTNPSPTPSPHTILLVACLCIALGHASPVVPRQSVAISSSVTASSIDVSELLGRIISWLSTALYLGSRLPQLLKNYRRKSTAGLSFSLFAAAFCGNLFYSSSLLTNPLAWSSYPAYGHHGWAGSDGSKQSEWILSATPFFLGAFGVLGLDAAVGVQFLIYGEGRGKHRVPVVIETPPTRAGSNSEGAEAVVEPSRTRVLAVPRGNHHAGPSEDEFESRSWHRVSGWMRGWVPSFSPGNSFSGQGQSYMAAAAAAGRSVRDGIPGFVSRGRSISRVRAQAEEWERERGRGRGRGSIDADDEIEPDEDRPLLERDDIPGSAGEYGSL